MSRASVADLRPIDLFDELDDAELKPWAAATELHEAEQGEQLAEADEEPPGVHLLLTGRLNLSRPVDDRWEQVGAQDGPTWIGTIAVVTEGESAVRMTAGTPCRFGFIEADRFRELAFADRRILLRVLRQIRPIATRVAAMEQTRERLASLGTMAAGLAHELNNPAAAAKRAAADLADALDVLSATLGRFVESGVERAEAEQLVAMQREALQDAATCTALSSLDAADREDELLEALEDHDVPEPWRLTEALARAQVDRAWLDRAAELAGPGLPAVVAWVAASLDARGLAAELADSAERMSNLVGAVKAYAYMDRGETITADVHEGLESTLTLLGHKLKHSSIDVERVYDRELPQLTVHGSELNQVWTNLLDNAVDALGESGTITLTTRREADCVRVDVADDGPGIPADVRDRVFDPFFTTKGVGAGTGMGLDTARRIVETRHGGSLALESEPGRTVFSVWLPIQS